MNERPRGNGIIAQDHSHGQGGVAGGKRWAAGEEFIKDGSKPVDIGGGTGFFGGGSDLFGGHVGGGTKLLSGKCEGWLIGDVRESEIGNLG